MDNSERPEKPPLNNPNQNTEPEQNYISHLEKVVNTQFAMLTQTNKQRKDADQTIEAYEALQNITQQEIKEKDAIIKAHQNLMSLSTKELLHKDNVLNSILETNTYISNIIEENAILEKTLQNMVLATGFKRGIIFMARKKRLSPEFSRGFNKGEYAQPYFATVKAAVKKSFNDEKEVLWKKKNIKNGNDSVVISMLCMPLVYMNRRLGIIYLDTTCSDTELPPNLREISRIFGTQAAISLNSVVLFKKLKYQTITDKFTGLPNRKRLMMDLEVSSKVSLALINIDNFSAVNVAYGIDAGNHVLKRVADRLSASVPSDTRVYRLSADEFVLLSVDNELTPYYMKTIIKQNITNQPFLYNSLYINIALSSGMVCRDDKHLLRKADIALKTARKRGRGYFVVFDEEYSDFKAYKEAFYWVNKVKAAVKNDTMVPYFQGIYNNNSCKYEIYETLVRIIDDDKTIIKPYKFLEAAKQIGMYSTITYCMIDKTFSAMAGRKCAFTINLSSEDFFDSRLIEYIQYKIKRHKIDPDRVIFEITEDLNLPEKGQSIDFIKQLKDLGVKIAIDDFGTDFSNFSRLLEINADFIKIDGSFIKKIHSDPNARKIVKAITDFSHSVGIQVIAEFVETEETHKKIMELGIEFSQGHFFEKAKAAPGSPGTTPEPPLQ